ILSLSPGLRRVAGRYPGRAARKSSSTLKGLHPFPLAPWIGHSACCRWDTTPSGLNPSRRATQGSSRPLHPSTRNPGLRDAIPSGLPPSLNHRRHFKWAPGLALGVWCLLATTAFATAPKLASILPTGAQRGTEVELSCKGERLEDAQELICYEPGIEVLPFEL